MGKPLPIIFYRANNNRVIAIVSMKSKRYLKRKIGYYDGGITIGEKILWRDVPNEFHWAKEYLTQIEAGKYDFAIVEGVKGKPFVEVSLITVPTKGSSRSVPMLLGKG